MTYRILICPVCKKQFHGLMYGHVCPESDFSKYKDGWVEPIEVEVEIKKEPGTVDGD